ncbi:LANO_0F17216g1_1 [Lachancea nothofagi CBS 11611]|uniref:LANO_0F17216g1_1 n=1 Tax=Lachancea nothofagi CBS 11611 TaxID=1266666 RepID=A0A1G4KD56_9SACH|nr:LANO_0F17216g1_1 [Lachancea nothofagi CBS 11611]
MDFSLSSTLSLAMDTMAKPQHTNAVKDLPVFKTLEETSTLRNDPRSWKPTRSSNNSRHDTRKQPYPPSLAAYSTGREQPFYLKEKEPSPRFNEFEMQLELHGRSLNNIKMIGWDSIRPIGIAYTLKEQDELAKLEAKEEEQQVQHQPQNAQNIILEENIESPAREPILEQPPSPDMDINLDHNVQEDETSYDYDDEFARIDGEDEEPVSNQATTTRHDQTVQQFIETSHIEGLGHPYDVENNYHLAYSYADPESHDDDVPHGEEAISLLPPVLITDADSFDMSANGPGSLNINSSHSPSFSRRRYQSRRQGLDSSDCE